MGAVTANGLTSFSPYILSSTAAPLPVELLNFDYSCDNQNILFNWCTATEVNSDHFTLLHSPDGTHFQPLISIPGQGNSTSKKCYDFLLEDKKVNSHYFRLSQTDFDGSTELFKIIYVDACVPKDEIIAVNNAGSDELEIKINALQDNFYEMHITNALGQNLRTENLRITTGMNVLKYDLAGFTKGIYYVMLYSKEKCITKKILINEQ